MKNRTKNQLLHKIYLFTLLSAGSTLISLNHSWAMKRGAEEDQESPSDNDASIKPKKRKISTSSTQDTEKNDLNKLLIDDPKNINKETLITAIKLNDLLAIEKILQLNPELALNMKYGETALNAAAAYGQVNAIEKLLHIRPELALQTDENGETALHVAALYGQVPVIEKLLQIRPELALLVNTDGETALHLATRCGEVDAIEKLLQMQPEIALQTDKDGFTALHTAAMYGQVPTIEKLLQIQPALALQTDKKGHTALHTATEYAQALAIEKLLHIRPEFALQTDKNEQTALHTAAIFGEADAIEKLLQIQPELALLADKNGETALHTAATYGQVDAIEKLLQIRPELALQANKNGATALHLAAWHGHVAAIEKLLQIQPELALQADEDGETALHPATMNGHVATIEKLLQLAPHLLNQQDFSGRSALHIAHKAKETVFPLIKAGIDPTLLDEQFKPAASYPNPNASLIRTYTRLYSVQPNHGIEKARALLNAEKPHLSPEEFAVLEDFVNKKANDFYYTPKHEQRVKQTILNKECATCWEPAQIPKSEFHSPGGNGCSCYLCQECAGKLLQTQREEGMNAELKCPSCSLDLDNEFIKNTLNNIREAERLIHLPVNRAQCSQKGWKPCKGKDCPAGRVVQEKDSDAYYACDLCTWKGCLNCGDNHRGADCKKFNAETAETQKLFEKGKLPRPTPDYPEDPEHPDYYNGRYRPCYYCGLVQERADGCNAMVCENPACKKKWHWNYGDHSNHPHFREQENQRDPGTVHDYVNDRQHFEPLEKPHF